MQNIIMYLRAVAEIQWLTGTATRLYIIIYVIDITRIFILLV